MATRPLIGYYSERSIRDCGAPTDEWLAAYLLELVGERVVEVALAAIDALQAAPSVLSAVIRLNRPHTETLRRRSISHHDRFYRARNASYKRFPPTAFLRTALAAAGQAPDPVR